jgi:hypothetical protein
VYGEHDDCYGELLGTENRGLEAMFILMNEARLSTGLQGVALGETALQKAQAHALARQQGRDAINGKARVAIAEHPDVKRMLLLMHSQTTALRALSIQIAAYLDEADADEQAAQQLQARIALLTPIFKAHATEVGNQLTGTAVQIVGGMGFVEETGIAQHLRDARITTIYEGTTGIQANDLVFRKVLKDRGESAQALLADIELACRALGETEQAMTVAEPMAIAIRQVQKMVYLILEAPEEKQYQLYSGAVAFTEAMGILCSAWPLAKLVTAVQNDDSTTDDYKNNIVALAEFYCAHVLSKIESLAITFQYADRGLKRYSIQVS